jgi:trehalose 6-phosphate synthase/phosphatase
MRLAWRKAMKRVLVASLSQAEVVVEALKEAGVAAFPIHAALSQSEAEAVEGRFCRSVLWPVLHGLVGNLPLLFEGYDEYVSLNQRFADEIAKAYEPGDVIWIHDYHFMLAPKQLRGALPGARVGFFLDAPFPAADLFRVLPFREVLLEGMLGADLIGFHTAAFMRHFSAAVLRTLGVPTEVDELDWRGRRIHTGVFPMGVDVAGIEALARSRAVSDRVASMRNRPGEKRQTLIAVDRLDYTQGIVRRLLAFEALLRQRPALNGRVQLLQVTAPSRPLGGSHKDYREQVSRHVGRINGELGNATWMPVNHLVRELPPEEIVALHRTADALVVTPIRDGMSAMAKEFIAARVDDDGVLVLSELTGAACELAEAVHVNPYDTSATAEAFWRALAMPRDERQGRMRALRQRVVGWDRRRWASLFMERLSDPASEQLDVNVRRQVLEDVMAAVARAARGGRRVMLLLDYDGTLVPFAQAPELARPDDGVRRLLLALAALPATEVHIVSGRARQTLEQWFGELPVGLHAEHGLWSRLPGGAGQQRQTPLRGWWRPALAVLRDWAGRTPGSLIEEKPAGLAWHYRAADAEYGAAQANDLRAHLQELFSNAPVEIISGHKVIELRPQGVHKGCIVPDLLERSPGAFVLAVGDDRTDEDLFASLPPDAAAVRVGGGESSARYRLADVDDVRQMLRRLVERGGSAVGSRGAAPATPESDSGKRPTAVV